MKMRMMVPLLALASTSLAFADSPDTYLYFRSHNFDSQTAISTSAVCLDKCDISGLCSNKETCAQLTQKYACDKYYQPGQSFAGWCDKTCAVCTDQDADMVEEDTASSARRVDWDFSYKLFDSPKPVQVHRYDLFNASYDVRLGGDKAYLSLPYGAAYIFTTAPLLALTDAVSGKQYSIYSESVAWVAKGSCLRLDMGRAADGGNSTVVVVSSGAAQLTTGDGQNCKEAVMKVGYDDLHNNPVDYVINGSCSDKLSGPGGATDYDDLDAPIGPLRAHYHTRGALYYTAAGSSFYNDGKAVPYSIQSGELRFVQQGVYYGPETMWDDAYVMSFHEPDPSARSTKPVVTPTGFQPCSFACCDKPTAGAPTMTCIAPAYDA